MRRVLAALALIFACTLPAAADETSGVAGTVVDLDHHRPFVNAEIGIYPLPLRAEETPIATAVTNKDGFFSNITLVPGRYLITANVMGLHSSCEFEELYHGVVTHVRIELSMKGERCIGKNIHSSLVVPGQPADVYIVH